MLIGVHAVAAFHNRPTGVEYYTQDLLHAIAALPDASAHRFFLYTNTNSSDAFHLSSSNVYFRVLRAPFLWTQMRLSWEIAWRPPDVLFIPGQALPRILPKRRVVTIHGVEFERCPKYYSFRDRQRLRVITRDAVRRASHIIAVSEATKQDIMEFYSAGTDRITVVHHGVSPPPLAKSLKVPDSKPLVPYFLYIGRLELKKNVDGIIRAFSVFRERHRDAPHELVLLGGPGFGYERIVDAVAQSRYRDAIRILGYVNEGVKWSYLAGATAFLFPSWAEGFGLPILEAQSVGVPVITSDTTAMPEVAGDGALFVDSADTGALADAMIRVVIDETLQLKLVARGKENVKRFSWEEAAKKTLNILLREL